MAKLIYSAIASLDGYVEDEDGKFDWAEPDEEVHAFLNDLERPVRTYLYGRRLYETMAGWETEPGLAEHSPVMRDFAAIWQAAEKIVLLEDAEGGLHDQNPDRAEIRPGRGPAGKQAAGRDLIGAEPVPPPRRSGPGSSTNSTSSSRPSWWEAASTLSREGVNLKLELLDERRFRSGTVFLRYRSVSRGTGD